MDSGAYPSLTWRTPLVALLRDDFVLAPEYAWAQEHLTLEDALSHRTGFPRHDKSLATVYGPDGHKATVGDFTRNLRYLPMTSEPRTVFRYVSGSVTVHSISRLLLGRKACRRVAEHGSRLDDRFT
jgi:CubicO group peptidase (beta-lactamase class C family)